MITPVFTFHLTLGGMKGDHLGQRKDGECWAFGLQGAFLKITKGFGQAFKRGRFSPVAAMHQFA